jgi:hypothetical protein
MFRKTLITTALASIALVALGSAAPASADAWDCLVDPDGCGYVELDTSNDGSGLVHFDTDHTIELGSQVLEVIPDPGPGVAPTDPTDFGLPGFSLGDMMIPGPVEESAEEPAEEAVEEPAEEAVEESADEPTTTTIAPTDDAAGFEPTSSVGPDAGTPTSSIVTAESADTEADAQVSEAAMLDTRVDAGGSSDPITAAVFGGLGALAVVLLTLMGFVAGRRGT